MCPHTAEQQHACQGQDGGKGPSLLVVVHFRKTTGFGSCRLFPTPYFAADDFSTYAPLLTPSLYSACPQLFLLSEMSAQGITQRVTTMSARPSNLSNWLIHCPSSLRVINRIGQFKLA